MKMRKKDKEFDILFDKNFGKLINDSPECCPSDDFVNKVMDKCCAVEIKQPFNLFSWIRKKHSNLVIGITEKIVDMLKRWLDKYYERVEMVEMGTIPIHH